jgi:glycine/D-amino acid oxidase-like deaminating enzyme
MTQIAIAGCGVVGAAIAYELSRIPGLKITLFDENLPASGATGAALGVLMGVISQKTQGRAWKLRQESLERYETLIPELESLTGCSIPYNRQGIVLLHFAGENQEKWQKLVEIRRSQGWELKIWDLAQLQQRCPQINSDRIIGAIYSPGDRQVNPEILTQALVAGAVRNGVDCQFGVKVENIEIELLNGTNSRQCCQIQAGNTSKRVDWLVIAAGLGATPLTASLAQTMEIRPVLGQALQVQLAQPLGNPDFQPTITGNDVHIVPLGGGTYWIGATVEFPSSSGDIAPEPQLLEQLRLEAIGFCPALAQAKIARIWLGKRPRPEGQPAPIIGQLPGYSNVLLAAGHYRNGVLLAPATALAIRDKIVGG